MAARPTQENKQRLRWGALPKPAEKADLYWSRKQPELVSITDGQLAALIINSADFQSIIQPMLSEIDQRNLTVGNRKNMGRPSRFASLQLESFLIYRRVAGLATIKETRERLFFDREAQELLDLADGLPSLKTMSRYMRERLDDEKRLAAYLEFDRRLRQRVVQLPGFNDEARVLGMDGSQQGTRYTPPLPEKADKKEAERRKALGHRPRKVTAPTAGIMGGDKANKGWQLLALFTEHGTLVSWDISPVNESESKMAERLLDSYEQEVLPYREPETVNVCTADAAFASPILRSRLQGLWTVPNIHQASHYLERERTKKYVATLDEEWAPFEHPTKPHYANWQMNGHRELRCKCDNRSYERLFPTGKNGVSPGTKGKCSRCGDVTITSGRWRKVWKPARFVPAYRGDEVEPATGNPLTYRDKLSEEYGKDRFGFNESVHATLKHRFGLLEDGSRLRDITEVRTEFAIAASAISILLLERHARQSAPTTIPVSLASSTVAGSIGSSQGEGENLPLAA